MPKSRWLRGAPLVSLLRASCSRRAGIRTARILGALTWLGTSATLALFTYRFGPDAATVSLSARAAALVAVVSGSLAALSIAHPAKHRGTEEGVLALAAARGFSREAFGYAELAAFVELTWEAVFVPTAGISVVAWAMFSRGYVGGADGDVGGADGRAAGAFAGIALFGLIAGALIGLVAAMCRRWGGEQGRRWLLGVVLIPWLASGLLFRGAPYLSIPGLLGLLWQSLTQVYP